MACRQMADGVQQLVLNMGHALEITADNYRFSPGGLDTWAGYEVRAAWYAHSGICMSP